MNAANWQRIEGGGMALGGLVIAGMAQPGWPWWMWPLLLLAPDLAMFGYLMGNRVGAAVYNAAHIYAAPFLLMMVGVGFGATAIISAGALWIVHIGADRTLGYGLKLTTGFRDTHLGRIGHDSGADPGTDHGPDPAP